MSQDVLLVDSCVGNEFCLSLNESTTTSSGGLTRFRGKFQEAEAVNKNKRIYPRAILEENVKKLNETIKAGGLLGELDHPTDSIVHLANTSHRISKLWWENNVLMGEGEILNTPYGKILKALISDGARIGISSRGVGNGKVNEEGILVIGESYKLITFDAVADPSTINAFQKEVVSSKSESISAQPVFPNRSSENKTTSIYTFNKAQWIAGLRGIVQSHTNEIKARINNG